MAPLAQLRAGLAGRRPTIRDVAARAGVSPAVVSRVLRQTDGVSEASRRAVSAAVMELGYVPNAVARSLVSRRSFFVGVIVSNLRNPFFADVLEGIHAVAGAHGYRMLLGYGDREPETEMGSVHTLLELRVDGLILAGSALPARVMADLARQTPVALAASSGRAPGVDVVVNDDAHGAELAVEHLHKLGHRRIALIDAGAEAAGPERRRGYEETMRRLRLAELMQIAAGGFTEEGGYRGARRLLESPMQPTAILAANDLAALGALEAIAQAGLRVPGQISLVGYDDVGVAGLRLIALTTVHQPAGPIGESAMQAILRRIGRPASRVRRTVLKPWLVRRGTTAPPSATPRSLQS